MTEVKVRDGENIESAIKRFRKKCERDGIRRELKKRSFYMKPSLQRKLHKEAIKRKMQKKLMKERRRRRRY